MFYFLFLLYLYNYIITAIRLNVEAYLLKRTLNSVWNIEVGGKVVSTLVVRLSELKIPLF